MYRGLELDPEDQLTSAADLYERALVLSGLSKVHGLPGLRSGWLLVRNAGIRATLLNWKFYTTICPPAPSEFLAMAALQAQEKLMARNQEIIAGNLVLTNAFMARHAGLFTWRQPRAGSVALVEMALPSAVAHAKEVAENAGILLLPGPYLGSTDQYMRLGLGHRNFTSNLARYEQYLQNSEQWQS